MTHDEPTLAEAYQYWRECEAEAEQVRRMQFWKVEERAYCALVRVARAHGYRPNTVETCADWTRRMIREAA